jgi:hypothetical protein
MLLELFGFEHDGHDHFSSLLPTSLNSAVVMPRHDLCIHLSQSSQAMTPVLQTLQHTMYTTGESWAPWSRVRRDST